MLTQGRVYQHKGLAEHSAALGAADRKGIGQHGQIGQGDITARHGEPIAQTRAVQIQIQVIGIAHAADLGQLGLRVNRAVFRRAGKEHQLGLGEVIGFTALAIFFRLGGNGLGRQLGVLGGQGQNFVPGVFDGTGLVGKNMPAVGTDHTLPRAQRRADQGGVGLRAADHKLHLGILAAQLCQNGLGGFLAPFVCAIAGIAAGGGFLQRRHHLAAGNLIIVVVQTDHGNSPYPIRFSALPTCLGRSGCP